MREIAEAIGRGLKAPVVSLSQEEAPAHFGWLAMFAGFDMLPDTHDPMADHFSDEQLDGAMRRMREAIAKAVALATPHEAFLAQNGAAA